MDPDAGAVGDVLDLGKHFLELKRESAFDGIGAGRDEVIGILKGLELAAFVIVVLIEEVEGESAGYGFTLGGVSI